ncbi:2-oxoacid:acceptor oxidoreductase subunit alpha [Candidatus Poribacteria bacterium]|nr:2-oxoacid:acceptor oxidoreductase subunit alpha [Candidatus Poribacteria bacterium]
MGIDVLWNLKDGISIVLCGEAGQGIQTVEYILTHALKLSGYNVFSTKEFMSRIRGGTNSTSIRVSSNRVAAPVDRIDILIPFSKGAVDHLKNRISSETVVVGEEKIFEDEYRGDNSVNIPFSQIAAEAGGKIYTNTVAAAVLLGFFEVDLQMFYDYLEHQFSSKGDEVVQNNIEAAKHGYEACEELLEGKKLQIPKDDSIKDDLLVSGTETVAIGAIAGGCNFTSFYPMSPSTGVSTFLSKNAEEFGIVAEQVQDEISAINMAIGAWYAGARAIVSTSGGGVALMSEGISLAGILETPVVIHLAQRPGPATGLPTRTEQGDLLFALFAGHGDFPRIMLSPGTIEEAFYLSQNAFNLADKYQVPVILLTDQFLVDSNYNITTLKLDDLDVEKHIIETEEDYKRYKITENGISPRGVPGYGKGLVCADSDEHDEAGYITEDFDVRISMVQKRLNKLEVMKEDIIPPELVGSEDYKNLIIAWGSTYAAIKEAMENIDNDDLSMLHFKQVYPLHPDTAEKLEKAEKLILIENNATGQFGQLLKMNFCIDTHDKILKYNGLAFSVEEIENKLRSMLDQED